MLVKPPRMNRCLPRSGLRPVSRVPRCARTPFVARHREYANYNYDYNQPQKSYPNNYNYNYHQQYQQLHNPPRGRALKNLMILVVGFTSFATFAYYKWWPKHTFPSSVARILRKGLWAESDKGENDFTLALKHYLEALEECNALQMDTLSDEYTGIQLKIAEMFERLGMVDDAQLVYNEIASLYVSVLTAPAGSQQAQRVKSVDHRGHLIKKDLRIAMKLVETNRDHSLSRAILTTHLIIAEDEVTKRMAQHTVINKLKQQVTDKNDNATPPSPSAAASPHLEQEIQSFKENFGKVGAPHSSSEEFQDITVASYEPFGQEILNAYHLYQAVCISQGDMMVAIATNLKILYIMTVCQAPAYGFVKVHCNLGSLYYLVAEDWENRQIQLAKQLSRESGEQFHPFKFKITDFNQSDVLSDLTSPKNKEPAQLRFEIKGEQQQKAKLDQLLKSNDQIQSGRDFIQASLLQYKHLGLAMSCYKSAILVANTSKRELESSSSSWPPQEQSGEPYHQFLDSEQYSALATYGLGVCHLHMSDYDVAERQFREARVKAKTCQYDDLLGEIERELQKVFTEKASTGQVSSDSSTDSSSKTATIEG